MEVVTLTCLKCSRFIGDFENQWDKFGKGHFRPTSPRAKDWGIGLALAPEARLATVNTVLEGSHLQDLSCRGCSETLGFKCEDAPPGHTLRSNELLLRLKKMKVVSRRSKKVVQPVVVRSQALETNGTSNGVTQDEDHEMTSTSQAKAATEDNHFRQWAESAIDSQKADIDRISKSVERIETDMRSFKDFMSMVRKELSIRPTNIELDSVRASIADDIERRPAAGATLSTEDLDLMTESIAKIGNRVSEVDTLKLEVQLLKSRVKRFEDENRERDREATTKAESRIPSVRPLVEQLQRAASSIANNPASDAERSGAKRRRVSGEDISDSTLNSRSLALRKPSRLINVRIAEDRNEDIDDVNGATYLDGSSPGSPGYKPTRESTGRGRATSRNNRESGDDGDVKPKRVYRRRPKSPVEKVFDEHGFPLTANGERDKRFKSGKFAGKRPTLKRRSEILARERERRSGSRGEMTRSEEREERMREEEEEGYTDDYEEEGDVVERDGDRGRERGRGSARRGSFDGRGGYANSNGVKENEREGGKEKKDENDSVYPDPEDAAAGELEAQRQQEALEKRDRQVRETLEREMSMNF